MGRVSVRRETGKEWVVRVHCSEGVAVRQAKLAWSSRGSPARVRQ